VLTICEIDTNRLARMQFCSHLQTVVLALGLICVRRTFNFVLCHGLVLFSFVCFSIFELRWEGRIGYPVSWGCGYGASIVHQS
jgi:hypothetical protein